MSGYPPVYVLLPSQLLADCATALHRIAHEVTGIRAAGSSQRSGL